MAAATPARESFDSTAPFYDELTRYSDYELAMSLVERLAERHGLGGRRVLDLGCGTGNSFMPLLSRGYRVTACDISPAMVERARAKARGRARVLVADMRSLGALGEHDLVTCIDEPVNYLLSEGEVQGFFDSVARNIAPGGVLVFDVNTTATYRSAFAESARYEAGGWRFLWRGEAHRGFAAGQTARLTIEASSGRRRSSARHLQRHWKRRVLRRVMRSVGLDSVGVYGMTHAGALRQPGREDRHSKLIYVARRPRAAQERR